MVGYKRKVVNVDYNDIREMKVYLTKPIKEGDSIVLNATSKVNGNMNLGKFCVVEVNEKKKILAGNSMKVLCDVMAIYKARN